ncbi:MAG: formate dehydrogenase accessory sulfurtransferase FdhD [Vicingaceae bacterium]
MSKTSVRSVTVSKVTGNKSTLDNDLVVSEEPLEIRLKYSNGQSYNEKRLAVTMRTPGNDFELAIGFLLTEGIIISYRDVNKIFYCESVKSVEEEGNVLIVGLNEDRRIDEKIFDRNFYVSSSCGVCGKSSIESVRTNCSQILNPEFPKIPIELVHQIPQLASEDQHLFRHTGGLHAAALFNSQGELLLIREDVGRHNAVDKIIGARSILNERNDESILFVSGRAGFELVQKCVTAGIPIMIAVGAPSSLAVDLAIEQNLTLIGFARKNTFNIYSGDGRLIAQQ